MPTKSTSIAPIQALARERGQPSPALRAERERMLAMLFPILDVIGCAVGDNVEVVLHDLRKPEHSIVKIVNGQVSQRAVGDSILSGPDRDKGFAKLLENLPDNDARAPHLVISDYQAFTRDGRALRSSTVIFRDSSGTFFASLCINADLSTVLDAHRLLESMMGRPQAPVAEPVHESTLGIDQLMEEVVSESVRKFGKPVAAMSKDEKVQAVDDMMHRGLFIVKGGVERAAQALGVTRFTIYNYLDTLKSRADEAPSPPE